MFAHKVTFECCDTAIPYSFFVSYHVYAYHTDSLPALSVLQQHADGRVHGVPVSDYPVGVLHRLLNALRLFRAREVVINDVKYATFLLLLQYIYCDEVDISIDTAMDLFQVRLVLCIGMYWDILYMLLLLCCCVVNTIPAYLSFLAIGALLPCLVGRRSVRVGPAEATVRVGDAERHQRGHRRAHPVHRGPAQR